MSVSWMGMSARRAPRRAFGALAVFAGTLAWAGLIEPVLALERPIPSQALHHPETPVSLGASRVSLIETFSTPALCHGHRPWAAW